MIEAINPLYPVLRDASMRHQDCYRSTDRLTITVRVGIA